MVLQDHFNPPLSLRRHWHALHNAWATYIASDLNRYLPHGYFAEPNVQFGVEIDVAAFDETAQVGLQARSETGAETLWQPSAPTQTILFPHVTDTVEILLFNHLGGPELVGAVELVSPANKDRPSHRAAFVAKCETYLQQGIGLVVVDVVTVRQANVHDDLLEHLAAVGLHRRRPDFMPYPIARSSAMVSPIWICGKSGSKLTVHFRLYRFGCAARFVYRWIWTRPMTERVRSIVLSPMACSRVLGRDHAGG